MRHRIKVSLLSLAVAVTVLSINAVTASANRISVDDQDFRAVIPTFTAVVEGIGQVECALTISGSLHSSTYTKTIDSLIGQITSVNVGACTGGEVTVLSETLPWHLTYAGFSGTLPEIAEISINLIGFSAQASLSAAPGVICLARSTTTNRLIFRNDYDFFGRWILVWWIRTPLATDDAGGTLCDLLGIDIEVTEESGTRDVEDNAGNEVMIALI